MSMPFEKTSNLIQYSAHGINLKFASSVTYSVNGEQKTVYQVFADEHVSVCTDQLDGCTQLSYDSF